MITSGLSKYQNHLKDPMTTVAILIAYHPDPIKVVRLIRCIQQSVHTICLVDNTELEQISVTLAEGLDEFDCVRYVSIADNLGIAGAQNRALKELSDIDFEYVLFLDQDSAPSSDMVDGLVDHFRELTATGITLAAIGPKIMRDSARIDSVANKSEFECVEVDTVMSSGMLVSRHVIDGVGQFDSELFIDHVETEWLFRAKKRGFRVFQANNIWMSHVLGERTVSFHLHRRFQIALHRPDRYFYQIRNLIWLIRRRTIPARWGLGRLAKTLTVSMFCVVTQSDKTAYFQSIVKGLHAGLIKGI